MDAHKEELATIETIDSGAVYTLALKTHVGMSVDTWRYFAGWCDKIEGSSIPISHARPNRNLTVTRREPIGVCGLVTPWNYPLMMLSWKMAACLAAGNTVVIKPAQARIKSGNALQCLEIIEKTIFFDDFLYRSVPSLPSSLPSCLPRPESRRASSTSSQVGPDSLGMDSPVACYLSLSLVLLPMQAPAASAARPSRTTPVCASWASLGPPISDTSS